MPIIYAFTAEMNYLQLSHYIILFSVAFSDSVDIKYEESRGRYGIATRNIKLGEILCVETPTVFSLHQDTENCCYHCFKVPLAPQPSPYTSKIRFCSRYTNKDVSYMQYEVIERVVHNINFVLPYR